MARGARPRLHDVVGGLDWRRQASRRKRDLRCFDGKLTTAAAMTAPEFENRILAWAKAQADVEAVVQIGSRVQPGAVVDAWSDWDYQLIVRDPEGYQNRDWPARIAPCWSAYFERTERGVTKLSAVFEGGWEADFVLLFSWQMKLVCRAMRHPGAQAWYPRALRQGIHNLRLVATPGYRVVLGGQAWEERYAALATPWPAHPLSAEEFANHVAGFWRHAVWVGKKILRGELRAAVRWSQVELREHTYALLAEEARLEGRAPRPEARQAERWLSGSRLSQTARPIGPEARMMAAAMLAEIDLFQDVTGKVTAQRGFGAPDHSAVARWLREELARIAS